MVVIFDYLTAKPFNGDTKKGAAYNETFLHSEQNWANIDFFTLPLASNNNLGNCVTKIIIYYCECEIWFIHLGLIF